jgi:hypothetical protein
MTRLATVVRLAVATLLIAATARAQTPRETVVAIASDGLVAIDPVTGRSSDPLGGRGAVVGAIAVGGMILASVAADDGSETTIYRLTAGAGAPDEIGGTEGIAVVGTVDTGGNRLSLLKLPAPDADGRVGEPTGVASLTIPVERQTLPPAAQRALGFGILSRDGQTWFELRIARTGQGIVTGGDLVIAAPGTAGTTELVPVPLAAFYHSLLLSPEGETFYVIDYYAQTIQVVDVGRRAIVRTVRFGRSPTKRPLCAADLSPDGARLYVLDNSGGILAYDTASWRLIDHDLRDDALYCLTAAATGDRLYATTWTATPEAPAELITFDAATGRELHRVSLPAGTCCHWLAVATGVTEEVSDPGRAEGPGVL